MGAQILHAEHEEYQRLLNKYRADRTEYRWSLSLREIDRLKHYTYRVFLETDKGGPREDAEWHFRAMIFDAHLNGLSNARRYLEEQTPRQPPIQEPRSWSLWESISQKVSRLRKLLSR